LHFQLLDLGLDARRVLLLYYSYCIVLGAAALLIDSRLLKLIVLLILGFSTLAFLAWLARRSLAGSGPPPSGEGE
jgi:hypothetical protein